ncbi:FtsX-like permease family protein [Angustibacter luteus]|uniref:FtsX-like permease family protein n=1 Tax=Angustibacter luteus TaxID=658456 RepID=A0ABW1JIT1_9ACTN
MSTKGRPQGRLTGLRLAVRGIGYRRATAAIVLALAVVAATAAVVAPLYARAAEESIARGALTHADVYARSVHADVSAQAAGPRVSGPSVLDPDDNRRAQSMDDTVSQLQAMLPPPVFGTPVTSQVTPSLTRPTKGTQAGGSVVVPLMDRTGLCDHLPIASGRCPTALDEVAMTSRSAELLGLKIGDTFDTGLTDVQNADGSQETAHLKLVGTMAPFDVADDYWVGLSIFPYYPIERPHGLGEDPAVTDYAFLAPGAAKKLNVVSYSVDVPVAPGEIDLASAQHVSDQVIAARDALGQRLVTVTSQLPSLIEDSQRRSDVVRVAAPLAAFQLVLLAWVILAHVVSSATQERAPELGLAKLRGLTPGRTIRFGLAEVVVLLLVAAPIGTALGWWLVHEVVVHLLEPGTTLALTGWVVASVLIGVLGGIAAAAVAARGVARGHVADLLRRVPGAGRSRGAGAVEGAVLALVVAGIVQLSVSPGSTPGPVASAAPGVIALASALVAARLLRFVSRRRTARALDRGRPSALYGWAGVARRAGTARTTGVLAAAICLLLVGVQAWTVAARERSARALVETGAAVVLDVQTATARGLQPAVAKADPGGTYAMAAMQLPPDEKTTRAVAVDGSRADAVAGFAGRGPDDVGAIIDPRLPPSLTVHPGPIRADVDVRSVDSPSPLQLSATVETAKGWTEVRLGDLSPGRHTLTGTVPAACTVGCRLAAITVSHPGLDIETGSADLTVSRLSAGPDASSLTPLDVGFANRRAWRAPVEDLGGATAEVTPGPALRIQARTPVGFPARVMRGDAPYPAPALVDEEFPVGDGSVAITGTDGVATKVSGARRTAFVPGATGTVAMVDLDVMLRSVASPQPTGLQVWLSRDDPAAEKQLRQALATDGVVVTGRTSAADAEAVLQKEGAVLALLLFLACGAVALLVATGAQLVAAFVGSRQRAAELASLRAMGVQRGRLRRALLLENLAGVLVALLAAAVAALVAAYVVLPVLPMADEGSTVLTPDTSPDPAALVWSLVVVLVWLTVLAVLLAVRQLRSGTAERIREGGR